MTTKKELIDLVDEALSLADEYKDMISGEAWEGDLEYTRSLCDQEDDIKTKLKQIKKS